MSYEFTEQDVLDKIVEIGNRFPDHVYQHKQSDLICQYTDGADGQGCIVGQALRALGVHYDVLKKYDYYDDGVEASAVLYELLGRSCDRSVLSTINIIQRNQDSGISWGQAIKS